MKVSFLPNFSAYFLLLFILAGGFAQAQEKAQPQAVIVAAPAATNLGINTTTPHASAALDVTSTTQGMLVPRMTQTQRDAIATPATGLMIFQTDNTAGFYYYNGSAWTAVGGSTSSGPFTVLAVSKNAPQATQVGTTLTAPDVVAFQNVNTSVASHIASWNTSTNTFTVGVNGAGWYLIDIQLTSVNVHHIPMVELNGGGATNANNLYGSGISNNNSLQSPYRHRGFLQRVVYLAAGNTFQVRAASSSNALGIEINGDASSYLKVVKLY